MVTVLLNNTGEQLELLDQKITYIKQATDVGDLSKAQASYTWAFKIPKTPHNIKILDALGVTGSQSRRPYEKIECSILDNGIAIESKGLLKIMNTERAEYKATVQAGIIEFFQTIGTATVAGSIDLSPLSHEMTLQSILDNWADSDAVYKYLIAYYNREYAETEYNGNLVTNLPSASLSPAINMQYLWDRIFEWMGWSYTFPSEINLSNDWMTYPQAATPSEVSGVVVMELEGINKAFFGNLHTAHFTENGIDSAYVYNLANETTIKFKVYGLFQIILPDVVITDLTSGTEASHYVQVFKNGQLVNNSIIWWPTLFYPDDTVLLKYYIANSSGATQIQYETPLQVLHFASANIDFVSAFIDFKISDFIKEVMMRKAFIAYSDVGNRTVHFKTVDEVISTPPVDWSEKLMDVISEGYIYQDYAQNNYLKHKHAEDYETFRNSNLMVDNQNLPIEKTLFESNTYAPEPKQAVFKDKNSNPYLVPVLKMFEGEIKEVNGSQVVEYKSLEDRFFVVGKQDVDYGILIDGVYVENFPQAIIEGYSFEDIVKDNYQGALRIINDAKILKVKVAISKVEFLNIDLSQPVYIRQAKYMINNIKYTSGTITEVELIKINM